MPGGVAVMPWAAVEATWKMHARTAMHRARVAKTIRMIRDIHAEGLKLFFAFSGGKDSTALAGLLEDAGVEAHAVHVHTELNTPGTREHVDVVTDILGMGLDVYEPEESVWDLLAQPVVGGKDPLLDRASAGSLLVAYTYEHDLDGSWTGLRADESRGRRMNARVRGALYQLASDGKWIAQPLLWWTAQDVFAYAVTRGLPVHPHYRLAYEVCGVTPERARVDCIVTPEGPAAMGAHAVAQRLYSNLWRRVEDARPSLRLTR